MIIATVLLASAAVVIADMFVGVVCAVLDTCVRLNGPGCDGPSASTTSSHCRPVGGSCVACNTAEIKAMELGEMCTSEADAKSVLGTARRQHWLRERVTKSAAPAPVP
jgi:hypothetical protein